ncbi:MAG: hypothetical protein ACK5NB_07820 [Flavobacteriaceae bacterium]
MSDKFRLPRKVKKRLKGGLWLYPQDEKGNSIAAFPYKYKEDYNAYKQGVIKRFLDRHKETNEERQEKYKTLDNEIYVSDDKLKIYVNTFFAKPYRLPFYSILLQAKNHPKAQKGYFNFINAYHENEKDDSYGNICCLAIDYAKEMLGPKGRKPQKKTKKKICKNVYGRYPKRQSK